LPVLPVQIGDLRGFRDHAIFTYQAIDYRNPTASAGIALMRSIREREQERQPLPEPLPPTPPPPYEYLLLLGTAIRGREALTPSDQESIVKQLRQALREEKEERIRTNVRTLLADLRDRPEVTHRTVTEIDELLGASQNAGRQDSGAVPFGQQPAAQQQFPAQQFVGQPHYSAPHPVVGQQGPAQVPQQPSQAKSYWDGQRWVQPGATVGDIQGGLENRGRVLSITAFVLTAAALVIPFLGLAGIGLGIAAAVRKEKLGIAALVTAGVVTLLSWIIWAVVYSR